MNEMQFHCLKDRLEMMEQKQQCMFSSVGRVLKKHGISLVYLATDRNH